MFYRYRKEREKIHWIKEYGLKWQCYDILWHFFFMNRTHRRLANNFVFVESTNCRKIQRWLTQCGVGLHAEQHSVEFDFALYDTSVESNSKLYNTAPPCQFWLLQPNISEILGPRCCFSIYCILKKLTRCWVGLLTERTEQSFAGIKFDFTGLSLLWKGLLSCWISG